MVFVKDGLVYHLRQGNHDARLLADLILDPAAHSVNSEPIPYPVNKFTVYWEYIKYEAAYDRHLWRRFV